MRGQVGSLRGLQRGVVQGGGGVLVRGLESQRKKGTLEGTGACDPVGVRNLQSQPLRGPSHPGITPTPASPPPPTAAQARPNPLSLCSRSGSGSEETAGRGELSPAPRAARPPPRPLRGSGGPPPLPASPARAMSGVREDRSSQALLCRGLWDVGCQGSSKGQRANQPHLPETPSG
uniref:Uncharacterized protein n=1 Tax=Molossus molossus TaxID=27622 RepID=A0A7J8HHH7_MOLMO|nr:hypothetical protein HJG59_010965 [Molossus molossus]